MNTLFNFSNINTNNVPDIKWTVIDKGGQGTYQFRLDDNFKSKSVGSIQTMLEMHTLMHKSISIVSPNISFYSDFPNYIIGEEPPPTIASNIRMPHHRNDLFANINSTNRYDKFENIINVPVPTITWGVVRSEPGTVGGKAFAGDREIKYREREAIAIFDSSMKKYVGSAGIDIVEKYGKVVKFVKIYGQSFDNLVQYNLWAKSSWEVEELTEWFQDYMSNYTGMFQEAGIVQMYFDRRVRDDKTEQINNGYHLRSVLYYIRTEKTKIKSVLPINRIDLNAFVGSLESINNPDIYIGDDFNSKLVEKWIEFNKY